MRRAVDYGQLLLYAFWDDDVVCTELSHKAERTVKVFLPDHISGI